jgi:hypothetical protein
MRRHWRANHRDVALAARLIRLIACNACSAQGKRSATITSYRRQRITDEANLIGGAKQFIDGMVKAGALVDDSDKMAEITYLQNVLSAIPDIWLLKYGRIPLTVVEISDIL